MVTWFKKRYLRKVGTMLIALVVFSFVLTIWLPLIRSFYIVFGIIFILFMPGFFFTFIFFPRSRSFKDTEGIADENDRALDKIERVILSIFFSITLITLTLTIMRRINIVLTPLIVALVVAFINLASIVGVLIVFWWRRHRESLKR